MRARARAFLFSSADCRATSARSKSAHGAAVKTSFLASADGRTGRRAGSCCLSLEEQEGEPCRLADCVMIKMKNMISGYEIWTVVAWRTCCFCPRKVELRTTFLTFSLVRTKVARRRCVPLNWLIQKYEIMKNIFDREGERERRSAYFRSYLMRNSL